ncbi:helix-turn-helix domain-containing protein [Vibrio scophthalmi]|uniref:helix-turn-helix domain-containing protein n=1 Tax=Vibrio scophthalmi TaxID=45658 RepID=UPI003873AD8D
MTQFDVTNICILVDASSLGLTGIEKTTLVSLSCFIDSNFKCFPSIKKLAQITGFSDSTIKRALRRLEEQELIWKVNRYSSSGPISNLYTLNIKEITNKMKSKSEPVMNENTGFQAPDGKHYSCAAEYYQTKMNQNQRGNNA